MSRMTEQDALKLIEDLLTSAATMDRAGAVADLFQRLTGQQIKKEQLAKLSLALPGAGRRIRTAPDRRPPPKEGDS